MQAREFLQNVSDWWEMQERETIFFYSHTRGDYPWMSQFYQCSFAIGNTKYTCAEQYMMAHKALLLDDMKSYENIMKVGYAPNRIRVIGRHIVNTENGSDDKWETYREEIAFAGNMLKFQQNPKLRKALLATGNAVLAEAAPRDEIWGIGLSVAEAQRGAPWRGRNLLGKVLMRVRAELRNTPQLRETPPCAAHESPCEPATLDSGGELRAVTVGGRVLLCRIPSILQ